MDLTNSYATLTLLIFAVVAHLFFCVRFTIKAIQGDIENYSFAKMALVVMLPFLGYHFVMQQQQALDDVS